jgi:hypothetical protein
MFVKTNDAIDTLCQGESGDTDGEGRSRLSPG